MARWRNLLAAAQAKVRWQIVIAAAAVFAVGYHWEHAGLLGLGAVLLCFVLRRAGVASQVRAKRRNSRPTYAAESFAAEDEQQPDGESNSTGGRQSRAVRMIKVPEELPHTSGELVEELLANGRFALLLRPETKQHLTQLQIMHAIKQLDEAMALVPAGNVLLGQLAEQSHSTSAATDVDSKLLARNLAHVEPAYLDRFCVTNEQYQQFLDAGGYEQLVFWNEEALPALLDFVDQSGAPGPRYWSDGQYPSGDDRLPVVGISWYEAWAYARWVGKRLPTDAEWTKAAAWPVESAPGRIAQRRYPWGESFDVRRAHLFGAGPRATVAVDEFPGGVSVGGIHQLIGNVWEWTATPLVALGDPSLFAPESIISIRGGAFDTYFENQATCHYQSGEHALSRRHNIGFRLALGMRDLEARGDSTADHSTNQGTANHPEAELVET